MAQRAVGWAAERAPQQGNLIVLSRGCSIGSLIGETLADVDTRRKRLINIGHQARTAAFVVTAGKPWHGVDLLGAQRGFIFSVTSWQRHLIFRGGGIRFIRIGISAGAQISASATDLVAGAMSNLHPLWRHRGHLLGLEEAGMAWLAEKRYTAFPRQRRGGVAPSPGRWVDFSFSIDLGEGMSIPLGSVGFWG